MLSLQTVEISYGAIEAIKRVSIDVGRGDAVAIIGANGAGKSTLLKGIAGLEPLRSGQILLEGQDISQLPAHRRLQLGIALSPEGRGVFPDQSVRDNLLLGAFSLRHDQDKVLSLLAREYARFPRLKEREEQLAGSLSGGEQQMLAISRALMSDPKVLLLDEPSLGLAPIIIQSIFKTIRQLREVGLTIILVEQMANQALAVADKAYVLETGNIRISGTGAEVASNPLVRAAYLGNHG